MSIAFLEGAEYANRYSHEEIEKSLNRLFSTVGFGYSTIKPLIFDMRDDFITALMARELRIAELEAICEISHETIASQDAHIAELEQQFAIIERVACAISRRSSAEKNHGQLYAEGCKP